MGPPEPHSHSTVSNSRPVLARQDSNKAAGVDSRFCCNICLEAVTEPVATLCGHLYCWPCLFRWLEPGMYPGERASLGIMMTIMQQQQSTSSSDSNRRVCPVCKAPCSVPTLVPIYVREEISNEINDASFRDDPQEVLHRETEVESQLGVGGTSHLTDNINMDEITTVENTRDSRDSEQNAWSGQQLQGNAITNEQGSELLGVSSSGENTITGLRHRIRFRSRDSTSENSADTAVPSRPTAQSPRHHHHHHHSSSDSPPSATPHTPQQQQQRYGTSSWVAPLTPTGHRGSLTHGLLLSIQQATTAGSRGVVPPLHRREGGGAHPGGADEYLDAGASEYLSRLLLMLGCFVILCLLLL
jgi:hypothetical protein